MFRNTELLGRNKKVLILFDSISYFIPLMESYGVIVSKRYRDLDTYPLLSRVVLKLFRKFSNRTGLFMHAWYGEWTKFLSESEIVIMFGNDRADLLEYVKQKNPSIRRIFWYWNPVFRSLHPSKISKSLCEVWSFDPDDSREYGLEPNSTFYFEEITLDKTSQLEFDTFFIGYDKGRKAELQRFEEQMKELNLRAKFHVVSYDDEESGVKPLSYDQYLLQLSKSVSIFDYTQEGQTGLTLRVMESLYHKKKLITNNSRIKAENFYTPSNIFILGEDDLSELSTFLRTPYEALPSEIVSYFSFGNWLNRFFKI
jgi:hypothetical protein